MGGELSINSLLSNGSVVLSRNKKNRGTSVNLEDSKLFNCLIQLVMQ